MRRSTVNVTCTCGRECRSSSHRRSELILFLVRSCGGSVGVYFIIKRNSILYLSTDKGTFSTPPYLDSHGEVDVGGR